jgi:hypothetical protein
MENSPKQGQFRPSLEWNLGRGSKQQQENILHPLGIHIILCSDSWQLCQVSLHHPEGGRPEKLLAKPINYDK